RRRARQTLEVRCRSPSSGRPGGRPRRGRWRTAGRPIARSSQLLTTGKEARQTKSGHRASGVACHQRQEPAVGETFGRLGKPWIYALLPTLGPTRKRFWPRLFAVPPPAASALDEVLEQPLQFGLAREVDLDPAAAPPAHDPDARAERELELIFG